MMMSFKVKELRSNQSIHSFIHFVEIKAETTRRQEDKPKARQHNTTQHKRTTEERVLSPRHPSLTRVESEGERRRINHSNNHPINHSISFSFLLSDDQIKTIVLNHPSRCRASSQPPQRPRSRKPWPGERTSKKKEKHRLLSSQLVKEESWRLSIVSSAMGPIILTPLQ